MTPSTPSTSGSRSVGCKCRRSIDNEQAWISNAAEVLRLAKRVGPGGWPAARSRSTASRPSRPASGAGRRPRSCRAKGVERPVLQEDVDRLAERRAGHQDRGGLQLVISSEKRTRLRALPSHHRGCRHRNDRRLLGHPTKPRQPSLQHRAHDPTGDHDVGIGQPVPDLAAVTLSVHGRRSAGPPGAGKRWAGWRRSATPGDRPRWVRTPGHAGSRGAVEASVFRTSACRIVISSMHRLSPYAQVLMSAAGPDTGGHWSSADDGQTGRRMAVGFERPASCAAARSTADTPEQGAVARAEPAARTGRIAPARRSGQRRGRPFSSCDRAPRS